MKNSPLSLAPRAAALEPSPTMALSARARKLKAEGRDIVSLTAGDPDFATPERVKEAAAAAIRGNFTRDTDNRGMPELLQAISGKFQTENGLSWGPAEILVSCGAKHSIFNALAALCGPGDEVLIPAPYWVSYPEMVRLVDARPVILETPAPSFKLTADSLRAGMTPRSKALILCSPSNPTGGVYSREELEALGQVVAESGLAVISDEIYEKILFDGARAFSIGSIAAIKDRVITVNGVSKAFAMTGWRIGYMGGPREIVSAAETIQSQVTSNACSISQKAALAALTLDLSGEIAEMVAEFDRRRRFLTRSFTELGLPLSGQGAFYLFFDARPWFRPGWAQSGGEFCERVLQDEGLALVPGEPFGAPGWARLSYAAKMSDLEKAVERLSRARKT